MSTKPTFAKTTPNGARRAGVANDGQKLARLCARSSSFSSSSLSSSSLSPRLFLLHHHRSSFPTKLSSTPSPPNLSLTASPNPTLSTPLSSLDFLSPYQSTRRSRLSSSSPSSSPRRRRCRRSSSSRRRSRPARRHPRRKNPPSLKSPYSCPRVAKHLLPLRFLRLRLLLLCCCCCCCRRLKSAFFALLDDDNDVNDDDEPGKSDIICFCATKTERVVRCVLTNRRIK
mmetsp:Transcript_2853/g.9300  ORF Transcript_2853/g.9300 Transcript_2853/m.9300 type:complete len:228 (-) Transcript_2853:12-695(-)